MELNASDDRGIQAIRDKVKSFAQKIVTKLETKSLDEIVFQDNVVNALKKTKETGKMQHLLFYGPPGTGKTSAILAVIYFFNLFF